MSLARAYCKKMVYIVDNKGLTLGFYSIKNRIMALPFI